ncbi:hypothetical protein [Paenibacillus cremeus]|uniref:Uncharacterized protein n=1 Tax=Paenibacillus cremeus TaxID=2163881 RepID=A0A559KCS1_9BACL|nr:hypothetical protein [Paenibacillus cremeus]TVY09920.1 hypothetical protein FPZ49_11150 [Paenibacillus cremeus]
MKKFKYNFSLEDTEQKPAKVDKWYDRGTRSWVVQLKDHEGNQIGDAIYVASKSEAAEQEKDWRAEYGI